MNRLAAAFAVVLLASGAVAPEAGAQEAEVEYVLELTTGGQVRGKLLNPEERPRERYVIRTSFGGVVSLNRELVQNVTRKTGVQVEYERLRPTFADTVQGQWELAEWCRENLLSSQRTAHLERIVELDPEHEESRRALGFFKHEGEWVTQEQLMRRRGYVKYGGRWLLPQEMRLRENRRKTEQAEREWFGRINQWRGWLAGGNAQRAQELLLEIEDPHAVKALAYNMDPEQEGNARVRDLYVDVLANIPSSAAVSVLVNAAIFDPDEEVRLSSIERLAEKKSPGVGKQFVAHLKSENNTVVNRAGLALSQMKDPTTIGPLIEALVTVHKYRIARGSSGTSATFSPQGGGLSVGKRVEVVHNRIKNETVRNALVILTGVNFGYNLDQWQAWHATQKRASTVVDARRDE